MQELLNIYLSDLELNGLSPKTVKTYKNNIKQFIAFVEVDSIQDVSIEHVRGFIQAKKDKSTTYINNLIKTLRAWFKWLVYYEYIDKNPMTKVKNIRGAKTIIETFTDEEIKRMLNVYYAPDYLSVRNKTILYILVETGIRCEELCKIKLQDINDYYILIHGKGSKDRQVPITPILRKQVNKLIKCKNKHFKEQSEYLFTSVRNKKLTVEAVECIVRDAGAYAHIRSNIRCSPHTIRHYYTQKMAINGVDIYTISRLLGHTNISITNTYLKSMNNEIIINTAIKNSIINKL